MLYMQVASAGAGALKAGSCVWQHTGLSTGTLQGCRAGVACWHGSMCLTSAAVAVSISAVSSVMVVVVVVVVVGPAAWNTGGGSSRVLATWGIGTGMTRDTGRQVREQLDFHSGERRTCGLLLIFEDPHIFFWLQQAMRYCAYVTRRIG